MKKLLISRSAVCGLLGFIAAPAAAADLEPISGVLVPFTWTGFYVGANTGGSLGVGSGVDFAVFTTPALGGFPGGPTTLFSDSVRHAAPGWVLGGQLGYNWQVAPWVFGVEADWQWSEQQDTVNTGCTSPGTITFISTFGTAAFGQCLTDQQKLTNFGTARARGGALINQSLWYVTGGLAWGTVQDSYAFVGDCNPALFQCGAGGGQPGPFLPASTALSHTKMGWTIGTGIETRLWGNWSAKIEYLYVDLGTITNGFGIAPNLAYLAQFGGAAFAAGSGGGVAISSHVTDHIVRVGVNYKLGSAPAAAADLEPISGVLVPFTWTGFYVGANTGGSLGVGSGVDFAVFTTPALGGFPGGPTTLFSDSVRHAAPGWVLGGQLGYNWQVAPWVFGVEADWQWSEQQDTVNTGCTSPGTVSFVGIFGSGVGQCLTDQQKLTNFGTARARGGALINQSLWYVTGGLAWGTVQDSYAFVGNCNPDPFLACIQPGPFLPASTALSHTKMGWTIGTGIESRLWGNWSAKIEYLYVDLGTITNGFGIAPNLAYLAQFGGAAFAAGSGGGVAISSHVTDHIVRVGVNYRI